MKQSTKAARRTFVASAFAFAFLAGVDASAKELITNGSFENPPCTAGKASGCSPWVFKGNSAVNDDFYGGKLGATVGGLGPGAGSISQSVDLKEGNYTFSFWFEPHKIVSGTTPAIVKVANRIVFATMLPSQEDTTKWQQYTVTVAISKKEAGKRRVQFIADKAPNYAGPLFNIDDVSLTGP
ncbi:MAG: hypothetical protein E5V89_03855 [Mesorhizobium sp.]|nr:MAG: hypothetical protein E5V89_03855 [Mesorhizobium sp.]